MNVAAFILAAALLSLERLCYIWVWHAPESFRSFVARAALASSVRTGDDGCDATEALTRLFYGFKMVQLGVFLTWVLIHGHGAFWPTQAPPWAIGLGAVLLAFGQMLNISVFRRLGAVGVFYGCRFGYDVPRCRTFPYSWFSHPQYAGAVLSIWGGFAILRYPHPDWCVLPLLETAYYAIGASLEQ